MTDGKDLYIFFKNEQIKIVIVFSKKIVRS